jgi:Taurine catabolism dioxygenase TauD, TfdA family
MTRLQTETKDIEWIQQVRHSLQARGYYYEPGFCTEIGGAAFVVTAARLLGRLYVPPYINSSQPVILTNPSPSAPEWCPFDRRKSIGWHNDFSTHSRRPQLSLSWIRQADPAGINGGAWRVASAAAVIAKLRQTREGRHIVAILSERSEPFGYNDAGGWRPFRIIGASGSFGRQGLRFYRRALEEGACLRFGKIPDHTREIITRVEEAADSVGEVLCASTGSLLIVENRLSLHDRMEQQVIGPEESRRQACLCFVRQLHQSL